MYVLCLQSGFVAPVQRFLFTLWPSFEVGLTLLLLEGLEFTVLKGFSWYFGILECIPKAVNDTPEEYLLFTVKWSESDEYQSGG